MSATLKKKLADLETNFWSKAKVIDQPKGERARDFLTLIKPLDTPFFIVWMDAEVTRLIEQMERIESTLLPIHPAFLRDSNESFRLGQWVLHRSPEIRRLLDTYWQKMLDYIEARFDIEHPDLIAVALCLFNEEIDGWQAEFQYLGFYVSREQMASDQLDWWRRLEAIRETEGEPSDDQTHESQCHKVVIAQVLDFYGRTITEQELEHENQMWAELRSDMQADKPVSESEAARYFWDVATRYPRIAGHYVEKTT